MIYVQQNTSYVIIDSISAGFKDSTSDDGYTSHLTSAFVLHNITDTNKVGGVTVFHAVK
jgi:hypothetical protein